MRYNYQTKGVCSRTISFDIEDGIISNVKFDGGCNGNLKAISRLVDGKKAEEILCSTAFPPTWLTEKIS